MSNLISNDSLVDINDAWRSDIADALYPLINAAARTRVRTRTREGAAGPGERLGAAAA